MAAKGLILSLRGLTIGSQRNFYTSTRGLLNITCDNARVPLLQTLWHTHTTSPLIRTSTEENKTVELNLSLLFTEPATNVTIKTPGFNKSNIIIGQIPGPNTAAILDPSVSASLIGDLVPDKKSDIVGDNPDAMNKLPEYKARHIQKIRRWKMNHHKLLKWRKRNKTKIMKRSYQKTKKKIMKTNLICKAIREDGEKFDALEFVKERIALAKSGGFTQDIWKGPDEQPEVPWPPYKAVTHKIKTYVVKVKPPKFKTQAEIREERKAKKKKKQQG